MKKRRPWKMPTWMERYCCAMINTGGHTVEELVNNDVSPMVNLPVFTLAVCVRSQVQLLMVMRRRGLLS